MPRPPLVLKEALPLLPVVAVCVTVVPSGLRQVTFTLHARDGGVGGVAHHDLAAHRHAAADARGGEVDGGAAKRFRCRGGHGDGHARAGGGAGVVRDGQRRRVGAGAGVGVARIGGGSRWCRPRSSTSRRRWCRPDRSNRNRRRSRSAAPRRSRERRT